MYCTQEVVERHEIFQSMGFRRFIRPFRSLSRVNSQPFLFGLPFCDHNYALSCDPCVGVSIGSNESRQVIVLYATLGTKDLRVVHLHPPSSYEVDRLQVDMMAAQTEYRLFCRFRAVLPTRRLVASRWPAFLQDA